MLAFFANTVRRYMTAYLLQIRRRHRALNLQLKELLVTPYLNHIFPDAHTNKIPFDHVEAPFKSHLKTFFEEQSETF